MSPPADTKGHNEHEVTKTEEEDVKWWRGSALKLYSSHVLSSWGDRMWSFALGIYLYYINPESLQLPAIYGFSSCISIILLGAVIGKWIDRVQRLRAAQVALIVQNMAVILCALLLIVKLQFAAEVDKILNGFLRILLISIIILFGVVADLGSIATKIALQKDWIVVLAHGDKDLLAKMNSVMRTIDLTTSILAPILVGQILQFAGKIYGGAFIGSWNLMSVFVEYYLLISLYKQVPQLAQKSRQPKMGNSKEEKKMDEVKHEVPGENQRISETGLTLSRKFKSTSDHTSKTLKLPEPNGQTHSLPVLINKPVEEAEEASIGDQSREEPEPNQEEIRKSKGGCWPCWSKFKGKMTDTKRGWFDYFGHHIRDAGLALALLYMTVLGFDNITRTYALSQGVSESYLGIFTAVGAVFGILGSISFPYLRKAFGELVTGNIGFGTETLCLLVCLISILTPGSPFVHFGSIIPNSSKINSSIPLEKTMSFRALWENNISVLLLLFGIVTARFGLWVADLTVTQIFQENIAEHQRGVLNGVQGSLNQGMNLIKFLLVILLPNPNTFAYLIALSWLSVFLGWLLFMKFSCPSRLAKTEPGLAPVKNGSRIGVTTDRLSVHDNNGNNEEVEASA